MRPLEFTKYLQGDSKGFQGVPEIYFLVKTYFLKNYFSISLHNLSGVRNLFKVMK